MDSEVRQKFQIIKQAELSYEVLLDGEHIEEFSEESSASEYVRWFSAKLDDAYEAGEIAMQEKAAELVRTKGNELGYRGTVAAIRALPLSGAEESKKEKA